jgi:HD-GYP domain-containing protein (c-di-GMP phosphodiesterase class II)
MKKIVRQTIDQHYVPISPSRIAIGEVLAFDCYIKRFNDYVIIIEAGTPITEALHRQLEEHANVYISKEQIPEYKAYSANLSITDLQTPEQAQCTIKQRFENFHSALEACHNLDERLGLIYPMAVDLMACYFMTDGAKIPLPQIEAYADALADLVIHEEYIIQDFLCYMPESYSVQSHSVNVSVLAVLLGQELGYTKQQLMELAIIGMLHDIGKTKVDQRILNKQEALENDEYESVKEHALYSKEIAEGNGITSKKILTAILFHHEKLDGSGYPIGLSGYKIPIYAQIIGVCDVFDAMTTDQVHRARYTSFNALKAMKQQMNKMFNVRYIDLLIRRFHE